MLSFIPGFVAWPVTVGIALFAVGRFLFFRDTVVDRLINQVYVWTVAALILFRLAAMPGSSFPVYELGFGCVVMMTTCLYTIGCARRNDIDPDTLRRRQRRSSLLAVISTVAMLVAGAVARSEGRMVDIGPTWDGFVLTIALGTPVAINTGVFVRMVVGEYRTDDLTVSEKIVAVGMVLSHMCFWSNLLLAGLQLTRGLPQLGPPLPRVELIFTVGIVINAIPPMLPLLMALAHAAGLDRESRACRRLDRLWRDLTAAVPEIVMYPVTDTRTPFDSATRVFRMTVEIRDALMHLAPYMRVEQASSIERKSSAEDYAKQIAHAVRARMAGAVPTYSTVASQLPTGGSDFETDLGQLLHLAQAWHSVQGRAMAGHEAHI
ncbi:MAB_1171c family putative transporter [Nocardia sp. NPDC051756]|uniref:MAB_1171c family putative transporter n=1 Tax=Nocardia sp. NPDC051756 TaxID=3154751 RepID=UPI00342DA77F